MTTIACNLTEIAADSRVTWEGVGRDQFSAVKLFPTKNAIYGVTGENCTGSLIAIDWLQSGAPKDFKPLPPEYDNDWDWKLIELSKNGIAIYNTFLEREVCLDNVLAVGSGRKVALYCMKYLGMSPAEAVREACKVDCWSDIPIYHATVKSRVVARWEPGPASKPKAKR